MRCHWVLYVLLVAITFADHTDWSPKTTEIPVRPITPMDSVPRLLRLYESTRAHEEERGLSAHAAETVVNSLKSASTQLDEWLAKGKPTDDVFKLLTLDVAADDLLANSKLTEWITYMKLFNQANPKKQTSLIRTLTTHYGDEALAKMVAAAKQVPDTATFAKRLQTEQLQLWLNQGKSPDDVFTLLKLDKAGQKVFTHPEMVSWAKYVGDFNKVNPDKPVTLFSTLATRFDDETLVQMLIAAKKVPSTKRLAEHEQAIQTKLWLITKKEPGDVFKLLRLDKEGYDIIQNPLFRAWVQYTDDFRKIYYGTELTTIATLTAKYGDETLTKMILQALSSPSTANIAKRLETEQLRNWYIHKYSPQHVFTKLDLYSEGVNAFDRPLFHVWSKYATFFGAAEPKYKLSFLTNLLDVYGEKNLVKVIRAGNKNPNTKKMATELEDDLVKVWLKDERIPMDIYALLRLERVEDPKDPYRQLYFKYFKAYALS